jgi:DNA-binding HxlR family transcriptional regulator
MNNELLTDNRCPMTRTMAAIGTKWKPVVIYIIGKKKIRFGQIAAHMPLISRKVLTEQLKDLEEDEIITRQAFAETPPRVEYQLTEKGLALLPILQDMCRWNMKYEKKSMVCPQ